MHRGTIDEAAPRAPRGRACGLRAREAALRTAAACLLLAGGCATTGGGAGPPARSPEEVRAALLGRNPGLASLRALVEARVSYAGNEVSLPGVLVLDRTAGFRLELLDPLDRPAAILFAESGQLIQYRPGINAAASLTPFPAECRGFGPADWVPVVLSSGGFAEGAGERVSTRMFGNSTLERSGPGASRRTIWFKEQGGEPRPTVVSWFCGEDAAMELRVRSWRSDPSVRIPARMEISYPLATYALRLDLKEVELNAVPVTGDLIPRLGPDVRWWVWRLPR